MATLMPGDIKTKSRRKLTFNAPFSERNRYPFTIANLGAHRIGWGMKITHGLFSGLTVETPAGVLDPKEQQMHFVTQETFSYETEDTNNHRITVDWQRAPVNSSTKTLEQMFPECIHGLPIRRKSIRIQYNP